MYAVTFTICNYTRISKSRPPLSMIGFFLLSLKLRIVLEPENQSAISISRDVIQQTAPKVLAEFWYVTNMSCMFRNAGAFVQPLDKWNMSNVIFKEHMFHLDWDCGGLRTDSTIRIEWNSLRYYLSHTVLFFVWKIDAERRLFWT